MHLEKNCLLYFYMLACKNVYGLISVNLNFRLILGIKSMATAYLRKFICISLTLFVISQMGCSAKKHSLMTAVPSDMVTNESIETRRIIGHSSGSRPIAMYLFSPRHGFDDQQNLKSNIKPILILGGTHGNEPSSAAMARQLINTLKKDSNLYKNRYIVIIPEVNPDGLASGRRVNGNQVDINRNFPAKNWKKSRKTQYYGGPKPNSEPETQMLVTLIENLKPSRILTLHSIGNNRHGNNYDGPAVRYARLMSKHNGYKVLKTMGYPTPGSFGSWAGIERKIPVITLELPRGKAESQIWKENKTAFIAFIQSE
jgi:murein peptide amidase A